MSLSAKERGQARLPNLRDHQTCSVDLAMNAFQQELELNLISSWSARWACPHSWPELERRFGIEKTILRGESRPGIQN
jgi:hypothetical protein